MANFTSWNIPGSTGSNKSSSVDLGAPAFSTGDTTVEAIKAYEPKDIGLGSLATIKKQNLSSDERKELLKQQQNLWLAENSQRYIDYYNQYANASIEKKEEVKNDIINSRLPADMANNQAFLADPDMASRQLAQVQDALNKLYAADKKAVDEAAYIGDFTSMSIKQAGDRALGLGYGAMDLANEAYDKLKLIATAPQRLNEARAESVIQDPNASAYEKVEAQRELDRLRVGGQTLEARAQQEFIQDQAKTEQNAIERAVKLAQARQATRDYEAELIKNNPAYREEVVRQAELQQEDPEGYMVGLSGNKYWGRHLSNLLIQTAPDIAIIAGASAIGGVGLGTAAAFASSYSGIQDQVIQSILDAPIEQVAGNAYYQQAKAKALENGATDEEADRYARTALGLSVSREHAGEALLPAAIEAIGGPAGIVASTGTRIAKGVKSVAGKVAGKGTTAAAVVAPNAERSVAGIVTSAGTPAQRFTKLHKLMNSGIVRRTGRFAESASSEGISEVLENASAIHIANEALGTDKSLLDGWLSNFATGALVGAVFGAPALAGHGVKNKTSATQAGTQSNTTQAGSTTGTPSTGATATTAGATATTAGATATQAQTLMSRDLMNNAQNTPFYRSLSQNGQQLFNQSADTANRIVSNIFNSGTNATVDANYLSQEDAVALYGALQTMGRLRDEMGETGQNFVDEFLMRVNMGINSRGGKGLLTYADLTQRAQAIQTTQAQPAPQSTQTTQAQPALQPTQTTQAQPAPQPIQGATNANQGTDQGASASTGSTANTQQGTINTAGQQNTAPASGSGATAEGSGTGRSTHTDTGTPAQDVHSAEPENGGTGQGTDSGRDSSSDAEVSPQPDTGTGSTPSQTEQRSGSDTDTEATGTDAEQRNPVEQQAQAKDNEFAEVHDAYEEVRQHYVERRSQLAEEVRSATGQDTLADIHSNIIMNLQVMLEAALGKACSNSFGIELHATSAGTIWSYVDGKWVNKKVQGADRFTLHKGTRGSFVPTPHTSNGAIFIQTGFDDPTTLMHEVTHAVVNFLRHNKDALYEQASQGNPYAKQLVDAVDGIAKSLEISADEVLGFWPQPTTYRKAKLSDARKGQENAPWRKSAMYNLEERIAMQFQEYLREHGYADIHNTMAQGTEYENARTTFIRVIHDAVVKAFTNLAAAFLMHSRALGLPVKTTDDGRLSLFGHIFKMRPTSATEWGHARWLIEYGHPAFDAYANGIDKNLLGFFDTMARGLSELSNAYPLSLGDLDAYQTRSMLEATAARVASQYIADGKSAEEAFRIAHEKVYDMAKNQSVVENAVAACEQSGNTTSALAKGLDFNAQVQEERGKQSNPLNPDYSNPTQAVHTAVTGNVTNSLNLMGYTGDATVHDRAIATSVATTGVELVQMNDSLSVSNAPVDVNQLGSVVRNSETQLFARIKAVLADGTARDRNATDIARLIKQLAKLTKKQPLDVFNTLEKFHNAHSGKLKGDVNSQLQTLQDYNIHNELEAVRTALGIKDTNVEIRPVLSTILSDLNNYHHRVTGNSFAYILGLNHRAMDNAGLSIDTATLNTIEINGQSAREIVAGMDKSQTMLFNALLKQCNGNLGALDILARNSDWFVRGNVDRAVTDATRAQLSTNATVRNALDKVGSIKTNELERTISNAQQCATTIVNAQLQVLKHLQQDAKAGKPVVVHDKVAQEQALTSDRVQQALQRIYAVEPVALHVRGTNVVEATLQTVRAMLNSTKDTPIKKLSRPLLELRTVVSDVANELGIKPEDVLNADNWMSFESSVTDAPYMFCPKVSLFTGSVANTTLINHIEALVKDATTITSEDSTPVTIETNPTELQTQEQVNEYVNDASGKIGQDEAERIAKRATELNSKTVDEALQSIHQQAMLRLNLELDSNELVSSMAEDADATDSTITNLMTTEQELTNAVNGAVDPDTAYLANQESSSHEATGYETNGTSTEAQMSDVHEAQARDMFADDIIDELRNPDNSFLVDDTERPWFDEWFGNDGLMDEGGQPKVFYANGNRLSNEPSNDPNACEVKTYARAHSLMETSHKDHARISKLIADGEFAEAQIEMNSIGADAIYLDDGSIWVVNPSQQLSYNYIDVQPLNDTQPKPQAEMAGPTSIDQKTDDIAQLVIAQHERYRQAADTRRQQEVQSAARNITMTPPQQAGFWHRVATVYRKQITDWASDFRSWTQLNQGAEVGNAETNALYIAYTNMKQLVIGARDKLDQTVITPYTDWCKQVADSLGMDRVTVTTELSNARTLLHIMEAAAKQQYDLVKARMDAYSIVDEEYPGARQEAIDTAEAELKAFQETQNGLTRTNKTTGNEEPYALLYGGKTIAQAKTEYQALVDKYGDKTVGEAVNRLGESIDTMITYGIEQGVFSQQDVASFGMWQYYTPLITKTKYEEGAVNDVITLFPPKMNYHRGGSNEPAVDGYTAMVYVASRMANNVGSHDFGQEIYRTYQDLANKFADGEPNVIQAKTTIAGLDAIYYNGLMIMPAGPLRAIAANETRSYTGDLVTSAQKALDNAACAIQVLASDPNNPDAPQSMEPMLVWFNDHELQHGKNGAGVECVTESHNAQQEAVYATFHRPANKDTGTNATGVFGTVQKVAGQLPKLTSSLSSLCTVYNVTFWPVAYFREYFERTMFQSNKTYRDANGNSINPMVISASYTANMAKYTAASIRYSLQGTFKDPNSKFAKYATEAKELGLFTVGSIKKSIAKENKEAMAIVDQYLAALDTTDAKTALDKLKKYGGMPKRFMQACSEASYVPSLMSAYIALREHGVDAKSALYYVTEINNTNQEGALVKKLHLGAFYPFIRSITQSAAQIADFAGINAMSFGQGEQSAKQRMRMMKSAAIVGVLGVGFSALVPILAMALGDGDEDEGYKILDNMALDSFTAIPIPIGDGEYLKLPLGFGIVPFAFQSALGVNRVARGVSTLPEVALSVTSSFINNLSPIGGPTYDTKTVGDFAKKMMLTVAPMPVQGLVSAFVTNRDYWGNEVVASYEQGGERASDYYKRRTPEFYRSLARLAYDWFGVDAYPEQYKAVASSYGLGIFRGVLQMIENDPLAKDPMFESTRDALGPIWTSLGATSVYAKVGNQERRSFYNFKSAWHDCIRRDGLYSAMKAHKGDINPWTGDKFTSIEKRMYVLRAAGYDEQQVQDYATMFTADNAINKLEKELKAKLEAAKKSGASSATYDSLIREYSTKTNNVLRQANEQIRYGKAYQRTQMRSNDDLVKYARMLGQGEEE